MIIIHVCNKKKIENAIYFVHNWIQFFVSMYNDIISNDTDFIIQLQEEVNNI
jgi:hypothetical protein